MRALGIAVVFVIATSTLGQEIVEIPPLAPDTSTHIHAVSADGKVALGQSVPLEDPTASRWFLWNAVEGLEIIPRHPDWDASWPRAISADGRVVVGVAYASDGQTGRAWRWTRDRGYLDLPQPTAGLYAVATTANADASAIAGWYWTGDQSIAFRWTSATGIMDIGVISGYEHTYPRAISHDGSVVAGVAIHESDEVRYMPFRWTIGDGMDALSLPDGVDDRAVNVSGMNPTGTTVLVNPIDLSTGDVRALRWILSEDDYVPFGSGAFALTQPGEQAYIEATTEDDLYVGTLYRRGNPFVAWTPKLGVVDLHVYLRARGIDASQWHIRSVSSDGSTLVAADPNSPARAALITNFTLPTNCPPDIDLNETLDTFDFLAFANRFNAGDLRADLDDDGELTIADFIAYQAAFAAGC